MIPPVSTPAAEATRADLREALDRCIREHLYIGERRWIRELVDVLLDGPLATLTAGKAAAEAALAVACAERDEASHRADRHADIADQAINKMGAALTQADTERARADGLAEALKASEYLTDRYRACWLGKPVRDLAEAEGAYDSARLALTRSDPNHPHGGDDADRT